MKLFVGIDVSSKDLQACLMNQEGEVLKEITVENNLPGATLLRDKIVEVARNYRLNIIRIGMEATSVYSWHPALFFQQDELLKCWDTKVYVINAKLIKNFKKAYAEMDKTDNMDAWVIADPLRFGRLKKTLIVSEQYQALQRLTRMRFHVAQNLTREKQIFLQHLFYKCSSFTAEVESSVFGKTLMDFFQEAYSCDEIAQMPVEEMADYLRKKSRNRFADPECLAASIKKAVRSSYRLAKCIEDSIDVILATSIESIRQFERQLKQLDQAITRIMDGIPNTLMSIPGIGPVTCAGIIAEIGDIDRFKGQAQIAKYAGLTWNRHQSGEFEAENRKLGREGNRYLRYYLIEAANQVRRHDATYKAYYSKKYHEVPKHKHKRALVLTARKLVRLIDALLRTNQIYAPERKVTR